MAQGGTGTTFAGSPNYGAQISSNSGSFTNDFNVTSLGTRSCLESFPLLLTKGDLRQPHHSHVRPRSSPSALTATLSIDPFSIMFSIDLLTWRASRTHGSGRSGGEVLYETCLGRPLRDTPATRSSRSSMPTGCEKPIPRCGWSGCTRAVYRDL
jgi:hypothetical protein